MKLTMLQILVAQVQYDVVQCRVSIVSDKKDKGEEVRPI